MIKATGFKDPWTFPLAIHEWLRAVNASWADIDLMAYLLDLSKVYMKKAGS